MNTTQKIAEIEKGCGRFLTEEDRRCGNNYGYYNDENRDYVKIKTEFDLWLCPTCQAKLEATKQTAKELMDDEIDFLEAHIDEFNDCLYSEFTKKEIDNRLQILQKQKEEIR